MSSKLISICFSEKPPKNANVLWLKCENNLFTLNIFLDNEWNPICSLVTLLETLKMLKRLYRAGFVDVREEIELQLNEKILNLIIDTSDINHSALDISLSELLDDFYITLLKLHPVAFSGYYTDLLKKEKVYEEGDINPLTNLEIYSIWKKLI